jgi:NAD(P)-dependent dehydrogenase (short-subunit alcohol dehydrogenase family)
VLFNNAGVAGEASREGWQSGSEDVDALSKQLLKSEFSEWARILETNVTAVYFTSAAFLPLLQKAQGSTKGYASQIINVTSISGIMKGSSGGQFAYAASKEAAVQMSKVMATEFLPLKIRVNQIAVRPERQRLLIVARHIPV